MVSARHNYERVFLNPVDKTVLQIDTARPAAGKLEFQGFWLTQAIERRSQSIFDHVHDFQGFAPVCIDPVAQVFKRIRVKDQFQGAAPWRI